jgi:hypothetical protein
LRTRFRPFTDLVKDILHDEDLRIEVHNKNQDCEAKPFVAQEDPKVADQIISQEMWDRIQPGTYQVSMRGSGRGIYVKDEGSDEWRHLGYLDEDVELRGFAGHMGGPGWRRLMDTPAFEAAKSSLSPNAQDLFEARFAEGYGVNEQPDPIPNDKPSIHDLVIQAVEQRKQFGLEKYGTLLQAGNGRKSLKDALEEILDLACYLMCVIVEEEEASSDVEKRTDRQV